MAQLAKIPLGVVQVRDDICKDCPTPCMPRPDSSSPCSNCAINRWGTYGQCTPEATKAAPMRGLGDLVAKIAEPIASVIGLNKATCGCQKRQDWLNQAVPFGQRQDSAR